MFHTEIQYHNVELDLTTFGDLQDLSVIAQYAAACQRKFYHYVCAYPPERRAEHHLLTRGPLIQAMDDAMAECRTIRTDRCEAQSKVMGDGHAETVLYCKPLGWTGWATVTWTTRISEAANA